MPVYVCQRCGIGITMNKNFAICTNTKCQTPNPTWVERLPKSQQPTGQLPQIKAVQVDPSVFVNELNKLKATLPGNIHVDFIAKNIQTIIGKLDPGHKIDAQLILNMFFFLHHNADSLMAIVKTKCKDKVDKSTFFAALAQVFSGWEIVPGEELLLVNNDMLHGHFLQAWCEVKDKWPKDSEDQVKFVKDIFISQKGYAKTARSLESWTPPSKVNLVALLSSWLTRPSNVSIFTKLTVQTETARINSTRAQNDQIQAPLALLHSKLRPGMQKRAR